MPLPPERAIGLWTDLRRWFSFVEGFARTLRVDPAWPEAGATLVWESRPGGRGRVTERVRAYEPDARIATEILEEALSGVQTVRFTPQGDGTRVELELEYQLTKYTGVVGRVADVLFIRRALSDSLRRTLRRYAVEAVEESEGL